MEELLKKDADINEVLQALKKIKVDINIPSNASNSDRGLHNLLIKGTAENDFKKVYSFVRSVEMGWETQGNTGGRFFCVVSYVLLC